MQNNLLINGPINDSTVRKVYKAIYAANQVNEGMYIIINSQGGDEHSARAIAAMLRLIGERVTIFGIGDVQSAAVLIFAACPKRKLSKYAQVMVHEGSTEIEGNASNIRKTAKQMEADEKRWCAILQEFTGTDAKVWEKLHRDETYISPEEALRLNLCTEII